MAKSEAPAQPELDRQQNGQRIIRYPFQTKKGSTVARLYRLPNCDDNQAQQQFAKFMHHWRNMNGKGPAGVIRAMTPKPRQQSKALVPVTTPQKTYKLTEAQRKKARDAYHVRKAEGKVVRGKKQTADDQTIRQLQDVIAMMASTAQTFSTGLRLLQDAVDRMQHKR